MSWILYRYISKEVIKAFFISIAVFTFVLLVGNFIKMAELIVTKGVPITFILKLFFYFIPYILSYTIPMSMLTATLLAFGRLSSDNEIMAMRSLGISVLKIAAPVIGLGLLVSLLSIPLNDRLITKAHFAARKTLKEIGIRSPAAYIEAGTFIKDFDGYIIFIHEIRGNRLRNIRIYQPQQNRPTRTITASQGEFISVPQKGLVKLKLTNGTSEEPDVNNPLNFYKLNFRTYYMTLNVQDRPKEKKIEKKANEMSAVEIRRELKKPLDKMIEERECLLSELHKKLSISFSALVFVIIAIPLAIKTHRGERSIGLGISVGILIIYWLFLAGGTAFALEGKIAPWFAMWFPNMLIGAAGLVMLFNTQRK